MAVEAEAPRKRRRSSGKAKKEKKGKKEKKEGRGERSEKRRRRSSGGAEGGRFVAEDGTTSAIGGCDWRSDGKELWLLRLPPAFDIEKLDGKACDVRAASAKPGKSIDLSDGRRYRLKDSASATSRQFLSAFICNDERRWVLGKPFARQIDIVETFQWEADRTPPAINPTPPFQQLEKLTDHYQPLGGSDGRMPRRSAGAPAQAVPSRAQTDIMKKNTKEKKEKKAKKGKKEKKQKKEKKSLK